MNSSQENREGLGRQGQLTIFLGIALLVTISFIAFIVNVGLFVKAKINLQNATDAAAWAGAAVQARQLSNIAYVNYQFRQIYKEWMFKYYILGNVGGPQGEPTLARRGDKDITNFRSMHSQVYTSDDDVDKYNVPSICINIDGAKNICAITSVPGLPRFEVMDGPVLGRQNKDWIDKIVDEKSRDCARRTDLNFSTAITWTYGAGENFTNTDIPAGGRMGAWTKSLLTAVRMRNLEAVVNRPPVVEGISGRGNSGSIALNALENDFLSGIYNERPIKAFQAAYRNLGGGIKKGQSSGDVDELADELILKELAPKTVLVETNQLGGYLIPGAEAYNLQGGPSGPYREKHYLDLHIMPVNYTIFYSMFLAKEKPNNPDVGTNVSGECPKLKAAVPVPAYIMGFAKNHQVLTYYSVKAETRFRGLFFPFYKRLSRGIKLSAYASAKPFGGRIGPQLFKRREGSLFARLGVPKKSGAYLVGLGDLPSGFDTANPLPSDQDFYVHQADKAVGGVPTGNVKTAFSVPNMIYDFKNSVSDILESLNFRGRYPFLLLNPAPPSLTDPEPSEARVGLYDWKQFKMFRDNTLGDPIPTTIDASVIDKAVRKSQQPTKYEALNWMLPLRRDGNMASPTTAVPVSDDQKYSLYAPLYGEGTLYRNPDAIVEVVREYMVNNRESMDVFLNALKETAGDLLAQGGSIVGGADKDTYEGAAETIYPLIGPSGNKTTVEGSMADGDAVFVCNPDARQKLPMASKFYHFLRPDRAAKCGVTPLLRSLERFISGIGSRGGGMGREYIDDADYLQLPSKTSKELSTAYFPGPAHGASEGGEFALPFQSGPPINYKRNYYSTKFVHTEKLRHDGEKSFREGNLYQEFLDSTTNFSNPDSGDFPIAFLNPIDTDSENELGAFKLKSSGGSMTERLAY